MGKFGFLWKKQKILDIVILYLTTHKIWYIIVARRFLRGAVLRALSALFVIPAQDLRVAVLSYINKGEGL